MRVVSIGLFVALAALSTSSSAAEPSAEQLMRAVADMQKEIDELKRDKATHQAQQITTDCTKVLDAQYGPKAPVTTRVGKLRIGALTQIWYYQIQKDNKGLFQDPVSGVSDTNETNDNSSFRIRRTELHFQMDMNENVTSYVIVDPAREATDYPNLPVNQGFFKRGNQIAPEFATTKPLGTNSTSGVAAVQSGTGTTNRALQDAWIDYHDAIPHHNFGIGQLHPWFGEEGIRTSRELDFVERSQIGFIGDSRDLGAYVHGTWWDVDKDQGATFSPSGPGRFQYWLAAWDGAGSFHSAGAFQNRPDDNSEKDFNYRVLFRPTWKDSRWGSAELGMSSQFGRHGESGGVNPIADPVNGLNRPRTWAIRHDAWVYYAPGSFLKGFWTRGEWAWFKERVPPGTLIDLTGDGTSTSGFAQNDPKPFVSQGWYAAVGYKMENSIWNNSDCGCGGMPSWLKPFEFVARYDTFQNIQVASTAKENDTMLYKTTVITGGVNYYIRGHFAKIQVNYNAVRYPSAGTGVGYSFHQTNSNSLMCNFQVAF